MGLGAKTNICALLLIIALSQSFGVPRTEKPASALYTGAADWTLRQDELFEGDIIPFGDNSDDRAAVTGSAELWPRGVIPYVIAPRPDREKQVIRQAMARIEAMSCLRFVNRTTQRDYVLIYHGNTCSSHVGRKGGRQELSLGTGCVNRGTVMHELLHAAGFYHEHTRSDRDAYIDIFEQNVQQDKRHNFRKLQPSQNRLLTAFDVHSVMLYGSTSFARRQGLITMLAKDGSHLEEVYDKRRLSTSDARRIRLLYRC